MSRPVVLLGALLAAATLTTKRPSELVDQSIRSVGWCLCTPAAGVPIKNRDFVFSTISCDCSTDGLGALLAGVYFARW